MQQSALALRDVDWAAAAFIDRVLHTPTQSISPGELMEVYNRSRRARRGCAMLTR